MNEAHLFPSEMKAVPSALPSYSGASLRLDDGRCGLDLAAASRRVRHKGRDATWGTSERRRHIWQLTHRTTELKRVGIKRHSPLAIKRAPRALCV